MSAYRRDFEETKYMSFLIKNDDLLEKYYEIWGKVRKVLKRNLIASPRVIFSRVIFKNAFLGSTFDKYLNWLLIGIVANLRLLCFFTKLLPQVKTMVLTYLDINLELLIKLVASNLSKQVEAHPSDICHP